MHPAAQQAQEASSQEHLGGCHKPHVVPSLSKLQPQRCVSESMEVAGMGDNFPDLFQLQHKPSLSLGVLLNQWQPCYAVEVRCFLGEATVTREM